MRPQLGGAGLRPLHKRPVLGGGPLRGVQSRRPFRPPLPGIASADCAVGHPPLVQVLWGHRRAVGLMAAGVPGLGCHRLELLPDCQPHSGHQTVPPVGDRVTPPDLRVDERPLRVVQPGVRARGGSPPDHDHAGCRALGRDGASLRHVGRLQCRVTHAKPTRVAARPRPARLRRGCDPFHFLWGHYGDICARVQVLQQPQWPHDLGDGPQRHMLHEQTVEGGPRCRNLLRARLHRRLWRCVGASGLCRAARVC
mmetsp:Transcript_34678/g.107788  ORF Transcript_34678/g.107788 Transcript_34678/m.107788 type:complete len:253 (+) Transcript_34678:550-1308(+)